jgi:hypothetical protein
MNEQLLRKYLKEYGTKKYLLWMRRNINSNLQSIKDQMKRYIDILTEDET